VDKVGSERIILPNSLVRGVDNKKELDNLGDIKARYQSTEAQVGEGRMKTLDRKEAEKDFRTNRQLPLRAHRVFWVDYEKVNAF